VSPFELSDASRAGDGSLIKFRSMRCESGFGTSLPSARRKDSWLLPGTLDIAVLSIVVADPA
jgi:hypothetical protein